MPEAKPSMNCRLAGILVPVFSLREESDLGIGDVTCLRKFVRFASETEFGFVQLLPINETGSDNSPYNAISSVAIEPMTLDCRPSTLRDLTDEAYSDVIADYDLSSLREGFIDYASVVLSLLSGVFLINSKIFFILDGKMAKKSPAIKSSKPIAVINSFNCGQLIFLPLA